MRKTILVMSIVFKIPRYEILLYSNRPTDASTNEAKLYMRNNKYRYRGIKNGDKKGHKLTFSCPRYDNCPRKGYIQLNNGQDGI